MIAYEKALDTLFNQDEKLCLLTAENRAPIRNLCETLGEKFIDTGICEQTLVGISAGLALTGYRPVAHALSAFLTMRAFEFIRTDLGIPSLPVVLVGFVPGFLSEANGPTHQALEDISLMRSIPSMRIFTPADENEVSAAVGAAIYGMGPCYIRYNDKARVLPPPTAFKPGVGEVFGDGKDVGILSYGFMAGKAWEAMQKLQTQGVGCKLLNLRTLSPIDENAIVSLAESTRLLVTIEDHFITGGLYSILSEILTRRQLSPRVLPLGMKERWFRPGLLPDVLKFEKMTPEDMARTINRSLSEERTDEYKKRDSLHRQLPAMA